MSGFQIFKRKMSRFKIIFFLPVLLFSVSVKTCHSQTINISFSKVSLAHVLNTINEKYQIKFAFDNNLLDKIIISKELNQVPAEDAIRQLLDGTGLDYQIVNSVYIIRPLPVGQKKNETKTDQPIQETSISRRFSISGLIKDAQVGEYLPYASVTINGTSKGTASNNDGFFIFTGLSAGPVDLQVSYLGYEPKVIHCNPATDTTMLIIGLERKTELIPEAVVSQKTLDISEEGNVIGQLKVNPLKIYSLPSLGEIDIFRTLQLLPGIDGTDENTSGLNIRRSTYDKNLILYDGFSVYNMDHYFGVFSAFNSKAIKDIQVYKGGFEAKYGGHVSGVIDITGKSGNSNKPSVNIGLNMLSADAMIEIPLFSKASFIFAARISITDIIHSPVYTDLLENFRYDLNDDNNSLFSSSENSLISDFRFYDLNAKLTVKPTLNDVISLSAYKGSDNLGINKSITQPISASLIENPDWGNEGASFRWARKWSNKFYNNFIIGASQYLINYNLNENYLLNTVNTSDSLKIFNYDRNIVNDYNFTFNNQYQVTPSNELEFGISGNFININYANQQKLTDNALSDNTPAPKNLALSAFIFSPYFQNTFSLNNLKALKFGVPVHLLPADKYFLS